MIDFREVLIVIDRVRARITVIDAHEGVWEVVLRSGHVVQESFSGGRNAILGNDIARKGGWTCRVGKWIEYLNRSRQTLSIPDIQKGAEIPVPEGVRGDEAGGDGSRLAAPAAFVVEVEERTIPTVI
jgi:hypothetical protein